MSDDRSAGDDREDPPFVLGLMMGSAARVESAVRRTLSAINRRVLFFIWGAGTLVAFLGILSLSIADSPDITGFFRGIATGLFLALLFAAGFGWLLLWGLGSPSRRFPQGTAAPAELETVLGPTLRELNAVRKDVIREVKARSVTRVPLGIAASIVVWILTQWSDDPPGVLELLLFVIVGAGAGEMWAASKLEREYRRLYKDRVLPALAARLGDLTYREASHAGVQTLSAKRILPEFDSAESDDEIVGTHRGLAIDIVEARLRRRSGDKSQVVFDGLVIELTLPRSLTGTTVVLTDEGVFGNLKARWRSGAMEPVRLEDPRFEQRYEVYSNDQIEARALLTPAFMERFMALSSVSGFSLPGALAEGNRLVVALPKGMGTGDLFEPPVYWKPAGGRALLTLEEDIRAVLRMADALIELDFWAAGHARDVSGGG